MRKIVIANWKMSPDSVLQAKKLISVAKRVAGSLKRTNVVVCPPFVYLNEALKSGKGSGSGKR